MHTPSFAAQDFCVGSSNASSYAYVEKWPQWQNLMMHLYGPSCVGKSHLSHIWLHASQAIDVSIDDLCQSHEKFYHFWSLSSHRLAVRIDCGLQCQRINSAHVQHNLWQIYHRLEDAQGTCLLVTRHALTTYTWHFPDLQSRMLAACVFQIHHPDVQLLHAFYKKRCADLGISASSHIFNFLLHHVSRSCAAFDAFLTQLNLRALQEHRAISLQLAHALFMQNSLHETATEKT